jgi:hypothetical protein
MLRGNFDELIITFKRMGEAASQKILPKILTLK